MSDMTQSGMFTIGQPDPITGKGHMVVVKCDLCKTEKMFDPDDDLPYDQINDIIKAHVCTKPVKKSKGRLARIKQMFQEYEFGTRKQRLGRQPKEEDDDTL